MKKRKILNFIQKISQNNISKRLIAILLVFSMFASSILTSFTALAAPYQGETDITKYVDDASLEKFNGETGKFEVYDPAKGLENKDKIRFSMNYTLPAGTLASIPKSTDENGKEVVSLYYKMPKGLVLETQEGTIYRRGTQEEIGTFNIDKDGTVHFKYNDVKDNDNIFYGDFTYQATIDANNTENNKLVFNKANGEVEYDVNIPKSDIKVEKTGKFQIKVMSNLYHPNHDHQFYYGSEEAKKYGFTGANQIGVISYEIKLSTQLGTKGKIDLTDYFNGNSSDGLNPLYVAESFKLVKYDSTGKQVEVLDKVKPTIEKDPDTGLQRFSYIDLPELYEGEYYKLTYDATLTREEVTRLTDKKLVGNTVKGDNHREKSVVDYTVEIPPRIENWPEMDKNLKKIGKFNESTMSVEWFIFVNPKYQDMTGKSISDTLPEGLAFTSDIDVYRESDIQAYKNGDSIDYSINNFAKKLFTVKQPSGNSFDIPFPLSVAAEKGLGQFNREIDKSALKSNDAYFLHFSTSAPFNTTVNNTVDIKDEDGKKLESDTSDGVNTTMEITEAYLRKTNFSGYDKVENNIPMKYWQLDYEISNEKPIDSFTIVDELSNLTFASRVVGKSIDYGDGSHYFTAAEVDARLKDKSNFKITLRDANKTAVPYNNDFDRDGQNDYLDYEFKYFDFEGNEVDSSDTTTKVQKFEIKVTAKKTNIYGKKLSATLYSKFDMTMVDPGKPIQGRNTFKVKDTKLEAHDDAIEVEMPKIKKEVSTENPDKISNKSERDIQYRTIDSLKLKYEDQKTVRYRLLLPVPKRRGQVKVSDYLPKGMKYVPGSMKIYKYENSFQSQGTWMIDEDGNTIWVDGKSVSVTIVEMGYPQFRDYRYRDLSVVQDPDTNKLNISFTDDEFMTNSPIDQVVIAYSATYEDDSYWKEGIPEKNEDGSYKKQISKIYENKAVVNEGTDDEVSDKRVVNVEKNYTMLEKHSKQVNDVIRYSIPINKGGLDLDENSDTIKLSDRLTIGSSSAKADLLLDSVKLYKLDKTTGEKIGEVNKEDYKFTYNENDNSFIVEIPDGTPLQLEYSYRIDKKNTDVNFKVTNQAELYGQKAVDGSSNDSTFDQSASATGTTRGDITIYKFDKDNNAKLLAGAKFKLEYFDANSADKWIDAKTEITDEDGKIVLSDSYKINRLYRITEVQAPKGYKKLENPIYFVWMDHKKTEEETYNQLNGTNYWDENIAKEDVQFIEFFGGYIYIENTVQKGIILPNTGSLGLETIYLIGLILAISSSTIYVSKKKYINK